MFEIGQDVVCINDEWMKALTVPIVPVLNRIYRINGIDPEIPCMSGLIETCLSFEEIPAQRYMELEVVWPTSHFRPVKRTDISELRTLLVDPPKVRNPEMV